MKSKVATEGTPRNPLAPWVHSPRLWLALAGLGVSFALVSCVTTDTPLAIPTEIPGATFIGSEDCAMCHDKIAAGFMANSDHGNLMVRGTNAINIGCEACHGPGSVHSDAGGELPNTIVNPRKSPQICMQCHLDKLGQFRNLPYHHPVFEGRIGCGDCHNPHVGSLNKSVRASADFINSLCFDCHAAQRGPFVFEHEAMRDGCVECHDPHGSVNPKLLKQRNANLCLKCHFQQRSAGQIMIGGTDHVSYLARGTCWSGGCHEAVHGSHVNRSLRF